MEKVVPVTRTGLLRVVFRIYDTITFWGGDDDYDTNALTFCLGVSLGSVVWLNWHGGWDCMIKR